MKLKRLRHLDRRAIERLQSGLLREQLKRQILPFSPHYRELFRREGISPGAIRSIDDLRRIPFTTKRDLLPSEERPDRYRDFILQPDPAKILRQLSARKLLRLLPLGPSRMREALRREYYPIHITFTTGRSTLPVPFLYSNLDFELLRCAGKRIFDISGISRDRIVLNIFPFAPHLAFWQVFAGGLEAGVMTVGTGGGKTVGTLGNIRAIERLAPEALVGVPGYVKHLLRRARREGHQLPGIKRVILGAEKCSPAIKTRIRELLVDLGSPDARILGTYGFTEARMAWVECPAEDDRSTGYHLYPDMGITEIVDPATGETVDEGAAGEIVYTPLVGRGSMILRYRTGDRVGGGITWEPCPACGSRVPRLASDIGRESHVLGNLRLTKIKGTLVDLNQLQSILNEERAIEEWQVVIAKVDDDPEGLDEIRIRLALASGAGRDGIPKAIRERIKAATEITVDDIAVLSLEEMLQRIGMEDKLKEERFIDRRKME